MQNELLEKPDTSNYFSFYGLEAKFELDGEKLKQLYLEKSKLYHPDFYANDSKSYNTALMASAYNNQAYKILNSEISRASYLLELKKPQLENKTLPQDFLMEMLELNEAIDEMTDINRYDIEDKIDAYRKQSLTSIRASARSEQWDELQMHMLEWKYLERLKDRLSA
jgi:molecular chaperone HscB